MFFSNAPDLDLLIRTLFLGPVGLLWVIAIVRMIGLRTFSKMTAFDFIITIATGSLLANAATATEWGAFFQASLAILVILFVQFVLAHARRNSEVVSDILENEPLLLVDNGKWNEDALRHARVADGDVWAKLREANVLDIANLQAVVLETTGDISVLHGETLDRKILTGVKK